MKTKVRNFLTLICCLVKNSFSCYPNYRGNFQDVAPKDELMQTDNIEGVKRVGTFESSRDKELYGELTLAGPRTLVYIQADEFFDTRVIHNQSITGVLKDLTKISLIDCITAEVPGKTSTRSGSYNFANIFPHFVISGDRHIAPDESTVYEVSFETEDITTLFYDFDAFGSVIDASAHIEEIVKSKSKDFDREIETGRYPQIAYFTGKYQIITATTELGEFSASHHPSYSMGGPRGVKIDNTVMAKLQPRDPISFRAAISHIDVLLKFFELMIGRPQNLLSLSLNVSSDRDKPDFLNVYWSMFPRWVRSDDERGPHPGDVLLSPIWDPKEFTDVLAEWLKRHDTWREARSRFFGSLQKENEYDIDRLIGAANMFDILPDDAVPTEVELTEEIKIAKERCRQIFRELEQSIERNSVLGALGRLGKSSLKHKIRHRVQILTDKASDLFPDLTTVTDEAVNCRNHYVHGTKSSIDYSRETDLTIFFTDTLEFVFGVSDLLDAGWDMKPWRDRGTTMSHPFGRYCVNYKSQLQELKALLGDIEPTK